MTTFDVRIEAEGKKFVDYIKKHFLFCKGSDCLQNGRTGRAITAATFLSRNTGIGDDQLVATRDSNDSVHMYDAEIGKCQGACIVPVSLEVSKAGANPLHLLNHHGTDNPSGQGLRNSHTALILTGAYDGRVSM